MARYPIRRGSIRSIEVNHAYSEPVGANCIVCVHRQDGGRCRWVSGDKRLAFLTNHHNSPMSMVEFLRLIKTCLKPAHAAWLTRWENGE